MNFTAYWGGGGGGGGVNSLHCWVVGAGGEFTALGRWGGEFIALERWGVCLFYVICLVRTVLYMCKISC